MPFLELTPEQLKMIEPVVQVLHQARDLFQAQCAGLEEWQIALYSIVAYLIISTIFSFLWQEEPLFKRLKLIVFRLGKKIPYVRAQVDAKLAPVRAGFREELLSFHEGIESFTKLPEQGMSHSSLFKHLNKVHPIGDPESRHQEGRVSGTIYVGGKDHQKYTDMLTKVYGMFAWTNPLHPKVFPAIRQMEAEVVRMCLNLFHGDENTCGNTTSGGTDSIMVAIKAYRDWGREKGITKPNLVLPRTAHPAFEKGCQYMCIAMRYVDIDPITCRVNAKDMARRIDGNTIAIVGSCPQYPHGAVDPIPELSAIAKSRGIGLHVDCCLGSFLVPFMRDNGYDFPDFDFSLPGVTSISCDTHKYGMAPKGSSVIMYRNNELRFHQYSIFPDWPGGIYATPGIAGSRPGALIALTWASMVTIGENGYRENAKAIVAGAKMVGKAIKNIKGIRLMCEPDVSVVAWTSDQFDVNLLVDPLTKEKGWDLNVLQFPASIHLCVTAAHLKEGILEKFVSDLEEVTQEVIESGVTESESAALYGMAQKLPDRSIICEIGASYLDAMMLSK